MATRHLLALLLASGLAGVTGTGLPLIAGADPAPAPPAHDAGSEADPVPAPAADPPPAADADHKGGPAPAASPAPELTSDMVYAILVGEIGSQRGDHAMAFTHYLHAARLAGDPDLAEQALRAALAREDDAAARRAATLWVELAPESAKAYQLSAYVYIRSGDRERALTDLRRVIELARTPGQGYTQAIQLLATLPEAGERLDIMRDLVALDAGDADAQFALATLAAASEDAATARVHAERASGLRPAWTQPQLFLVRLLIDSDDADGAATALDRFLADAPDDQDLLMLRAQLYLQGDDYAAALGVLDQVLGNGPGQPDVLFAAAAVAMEAQELDAARGYLDELAKTNRRPSDVAFLRGQVEEAADDPVQAIAWYERVQGDNRANAQVRIAGVHAAQGDLPQAREIMQALRVQFPDDSAMMYLIEGELLRKQNQPQQAIDLYTGALEANPDDPDLLYARAMAAVGIDRVDLLERDLRQILLNDPDHVDALNALGYTLADRTDRFEEARRFIERALQLRPDEPAIMDSMGWVLYRLGELEAAEGYLRQALEQVFDAEIAAHLGEVLWELGRQDEARTVWRKALDEDPEHEYLLRVLGRYRISAAER